MGRALIVRMTMRPALIGIVRRLGAGIGEVPAEAPGADHPRGLAPNNMRRLGGGASAGAHCVNGRLLVTTVLRHRRVERKAPFEASARACAPRSCTGRYRLRRA